MLLLFLSPPETPQEVLRARLEHKIRAIADGVDGVVGVTIQDLTTTERFALRGDTVFTQASAIKLPVLVELFRQVEQGRHGLDDLITLEENDVVPGSGVLQRLTPGSVRMTLRDVATLMVTVSDNTATNMIIDRVGMENVNQTMVRHGLPQTKLQRKMMDSEAWLADRDELVDPKRAGPSSGAHSPRRRAERCLTERAPPYPLDSEVEPHTAALAQRSTGGPQDRDRVGCRRGCRYRLSGGSAVHHCGRNWLVDGPEAELRPRARSL